MNKQTGSTTVEFALTALVFFILLFGIIEIGRAFFVWNALTEATRRGARVAVVTQVTNPVDSSIANTAAFHTPDGSGPAAVPGLTTDHISTEYLDDSSAAIADPVTNFDDIAFVEVSITGFQHTLLIPGFQDTFVTPDFRTVLPRESLGVLPE